MYQMLDPRDFTVFITGATSGFGAAAARRFAGAGSRVIAVGRRQERLEVLQEELGERCHIVQLDVRDRAGLETAIAAIPAPFDAINVVLANAGLALGLQPAAETDIADWETMVETNIKGVMYTVHALLPGLIARGGGHIVTMGSVAGDYSYPGASVYGASKAFVKQLALNLRSDVQGKKVRVTNIEPGIAETEFSLVRYKGDAARAASHYERTKSMTAEDIAETVFWATTMPAHVNINRIQMMATTQAFAAFDIHRED